MKAVVLCAGFGNRMGGRIKPLLKVGGREILFRTLTYLTQNGVNEFVIVVNPNNRREIEEFLRANRFDFKIVENRHPEKGNGYTFYLAKDYVDERFVLVMGDHVYEESFVKKAVSGDGLICDEKPLYIDIDEATKVLTKNGRIERIGKDLREWCCIDTGFFVLTKDVFKHAEKLVKEKDVVSLSEIMEKARIPVTKISNHFWMDIDTEEELRLANKLIVRRSFKGHGDGFISRHLNRKISLRISEILVNRITPNQATLMSFFIGILASLIALISVPLGGLFYQISSILDGVDGEIARASLRTTKFGGWLDSILDRYVDFLFLLTLAFLSDLNSFGWVVVSFALFGTIMVSYTTERYKGAFFRDFYRDFKLPIPGKRDERIFIIMVFTLLWNFVNPIYLFVLIAILTNLRVLVTIYIVAK